ncbi:MAG: hypothetical protein IKR76_09240, partial [Ruminococcus sp.]|nr:hypothetical protein [Ruminococcus sp.]
MAGTYYIAAFALSAVLMLIYSFIYHRHFDVHISLVFILVPISNLSQVMLSRARSLEAALLANKVMYISACYLILMLTLIVFSLCDIKLNRYIRLVLYLISTTVFCFTLQIDENRLYYKNAQYKVEKGTVVLIKEYGPLHKFFYAMVIIYFLMGMGAIAYSYFKKNQVSRKFIYLLALPEVLSVFSFFVGRKLSKTFDFIPNVELIPLAYDIALVVYLIIVHRLVLYDISDTVIDSLVQKGDTGFISFDFGLNYLGSNETAKRIFPELMN